MEELRVLTLVLVKLLGVVLQSFEYSNLHKFLQRQLLVRPILQLDVGLFGQEEVCLRELLLVGVELFLEGGHLATGMPFSQVSQLGLVLVLLLSLLVAEVLLLSLNDDVQLRFFALDLLNQLFEVGDFLEVLDLLGGDLLVEQILLFLVSDLVLQVSLAH